MINLLPPELKDNYRYARRNVALRRWVVLCLVALVGLGAIATYGMLTIHQSTLHYQAEINSAESALQKEHYTLTQQQVQDMDNNFKLVVKVLSQEILFSQLLKQMGTAIPANANLTGLSIGQTKGGIDIAAEAVDYHTATQVQVNLSDPKNQIFSKADLQNVSCNSATATDPLYPCIVNIRALFAAKNPFLFINNAKGKP